MIIKSKNQKKAFIKEFKTKLVILKKSLSESQWIEIKPELYRYFDRYMRTINQDKLNKIIKEFNDYLDELNHKVIDRNIKNERKEQMIYEQQSLF